MPLSISGENVSPMESSRKIVTADDFYETHLQYNFLCSFRNRKSNLEKLIINKLYDLSKL